MITVNEKMKALGTVRSVIRDTFEYGLARKKEIGEKNVFDFSLGNPSVAAPGIVDATAAELLGGDTTPIHGYTSATGAEATRRAVAEDINRRFDAGISPSDIYMTCGAAASLTVTLHAILCPGDEVVVIAPFFPEYRVFIEKAGATCVVAEADTEHFQINFDSLESCLTPRTRALIINTPNNPTGTVLTTETLSRLTAMLRTYSREYGRDILLISDEPYRELIYDSDITLPYMTNIYDSTVVCYSFSKSMSLPGERIGYIVVSPRISNHAEVYAAVCGAGRALGFVCAPSLMQHLLPRAIGHTSDIEAYRQNRDLLYGALTDMGFECVHPDGAFYLFVKAPIADAGEFCMTARDYELLLVPSDSFGTPGYVRISYCVSHSMIERSLPAFRALAEHYNLK